MERPSKVNFAPSTRLGPMLLLGGFVGWGEGGDPTGGIEAQTSRTLANIQSELERHDLNISSICRLRFYLTDMSEWRVARARVVEFFDGNLPAATAVGVTSLAEDWMLIEVEADCAIA